MSDGGPFFPSEEDLARSFRDASASDFVLAALEWTRSGNPATAVLLCGIARARGEKSPALSVSEAAARFSAGDHDGAFQLTTEVLRTSPFELGALHLEAHMHAALGRHTEARGRLTALIDACPDYPSAQPLLARLLMPGPPYRDVLARIHATLRPRTYVEIGVESGATLALASTASVAVGVDPAALPRAFALPRNARHYQESSDAFFARETRRSVFGEATVDLAFIDGMHHFEFALRDFANLEAWSSERGAIVLHDCLSVTKVAAERERRSTFWVGDVWKGLEALLEFRPDLRISVVPTPPSGLVIVRKLDPGSQVLRSRMDEIVARYRDREYPYPCGQWPADYPIVDNDVAGLTKALLP